MADQEHKGVLTPETFERMREMTKVVETWPAWMKGSPRNERTAPQPESIRAPSETESNRFTNLKD